MKKYFIPLMVMILVFGFCGNKVSALDLKATRLVLPNGLTIILHEKHDLPLVVIKAMVKTGSLYETEERAGLASFVANLLRRGTKTRSAEEIAAQIEFVGGKLSTYGRRDRSYALCEVLKKDLDLGLEVLSDILINPDFSSREVEKERALTLAQISSNQDQPMIVAKMAYDDLIYGKHPYHRPVLGYTKTVKAISSPDLLSFYNKYYLPNNTILAIVGDIDCARTIGKIKEKFMKWEKRPVTFPPISSIMAQTAIKRKNLFMKKEQTHILLGNLGIRRSNPDYYALLVLDEILGGDLSARIFSNLRDRLGLAYSAYASITASAAQEPGEFLAYIAVSPFNTGKAIKGLLSEIERIRNELVTSQEIEDAKNYLTGSYYFEFQSNRDFADYLLFCENYGLGFDYLKKYPDYIQVVKISDIQRVAQKYLHPQAYSVVVVGP